MRCLKHVSKATEPKRKRDKAGSRFVEDGRGQASCIPVTRRVETMFDLKGGILVHRRGGRKGLLWRDHDRKRRSKAKSRPHRKETAARNLCAKVMGTGRFENGFGPDYKESI